MIIIFVDSHQVQVYWGDLSHREMIEIWFCHSLVRHSYYIWDASMTRTNIGSLIEKWFSDTLFATLMSSMLHVCIVAHQSPIIPCLFFYNYHCLINRWPLHLCLPISQDNVFCACLWSLTRKPPFTRYDWERRLLNWNQNRGRLQAMGYTYKGHQTREEKEDSAG